ncbi:hypothetical protein B5F35_14435 [Anaeromassilibacillus sp. An200]|nr:hypothetical protein B5F35_14435 [Anaeromassilibacillus sp. An200]
MRTIEIARKLAQYKKNKQAQTAYIAALEQGELTPQEELEAASYLFVSKGDYKVAYSTFVSLFNRGLFQAELLDLMSQAFYFPNLNKLRQRYEENCRALEKYPYLFRKDFVPFEDLPIWFFPYDDKSYIPYYPAESRFGNHLNLNHPVIDRYFFKDLENPILAKDVLSQYQLEYLNDTVRKSEWVGRENHIYLHYSDWSQFCAYLQVLEIKKLLQEEKLVFLIEEESSLYPIDFKARFGIDYSQYPLRPVGVREVKRMIWHTQLATHNGGDFFNEILYEHPNVLALESIMMQNVEEVIRQAKFSWKRDRAHFGDKHLQSLLSHIKSPTDKDFFVAAFLNNPICTRFIDPGSRIAPILLFQPHFPNMVYEIHGSKDSKRCILYSKQYEQIRKSPIFRQFKYIKTFTPMRRITTSYAASTRFAYQLAMKDEERSHVVNDMLTTRMLNRSFMVDPTDRLYQDSVLVRFEDGKLNPTATFTALAEFLDIPYTESLTHCTTANGINQPATKTRVGGFDLSTVYRTYDEFADDDDRAFLEYFMRDAYAYYGYDFHYYHGETVDDAWIEEKSKKAYHLDSFIYETYFEACKGAWRKELIEKNLPLDDPANVKNVEEQADVQAQMRVKKYQNNRVQVANTLRLGLQFVNKQLQPLHMMPLLKLNPDLLENPLYR